MSRWKAASIHLAISAVVTGTAVTVFLSLWFPPPHFSVGGGFKLLSTIVLVDVMLGPLLTLVVYRAGKKGLRFDLVVIGTLQVCALTYGLVVAHSARPAYLVITPDRATLVRATEVVVDPLPTDYREPPFHGIELVALRKLADEALWSRMVEEVMDGKPDLDYRPAFYQPPAGNLGDIAARAERLAARVAADPARGRCLQDWTRDLGYTDIDALRILPVIGSASDAEVVVDTAAGRLVDYLPAAGDADGC